jgi:hypothetical protein
VGSLIEFNDVLQLTTEQGFPADLLDLTVHQARPIPTASVSATLFTFSGKPNARVFQLDPAPVRLVHNIDGKWLYWARALVQSVTVAKVLGADGSWTPDSWATSGTYKIIDLYDPDFQRVYTMREAPPGKSYFPPAP